MTFQPPPPPPPPPGGTPPPPPPGQWGPPPGGGAPGGSGGFDPKSVNTFDWGILGIGVVLFLFSFFDYYTVSFEGFSDSTGAWHTDGGTFWGWLAMILGVAAAAVVAIALFAPTVKIPLATYVLSLFLFLASVVFYLIGFVATTDGLGHGFSYWLSFILAIAGTVLSVMRAQQTNTALPGPLASIPKIGK